MQGRIKWAGEAMFIAEAGSGHAVVMDGPPEGGGRNMGVRPMEMLLLGMGGCTSYDVVHILKKARQAVTDCVAELSAERAETAGYEPAARCRRAGGPERAAARRSWSRVRVRLSPRSDSKMMAGASPSADREILSDKHVKRAVELSADKYCSASIMLANGGVAISHDYEIVEAG